jgi:hypothetical protein
VDNPAFEPAESSEWTALLRRIRDNDAMLREVLWTTSDISDEMLDGLCQSLSTNTHLVRLSLRCSNDLSDDAVHRNAMAIFASTVTWVQFVPDNWPPMIEPEPFTSRWSVSAMRVWHGLGSTLAWVSMQGIRTRQHSAIQEATPPNARVGGTIVHGPGNRIIVQAPTLSME